MKNWEYVKFVYGVTYENIEEFADSILCPTDFNEKLQERGDNFSMCDNECNKCWDLNITKGAILDDFEKIHSIWGSLSEESQKEFCEKVAGRYKVNKLASLMEYWIDFKKN